VFRLNSLTVLLHMFKETKSVQGSVQQKVTGLPSVYEFTFEGTCLVSGNWSTVIGQQNWEFPLMSGSLMRLAFGPH
jgi:hypothetical protein